MKEILREIGTIARALDSISNIEFKEIDLTKGQYLYLIRIYEHPGSIQEKIAEMLKVDRTTAARAITKLENQGFIYKQEDPSNRKIKKLFPTERGKEVYQFLLRENNHSEAVALKGLSSTEVETLFNLLQTVRKNIDVDWNEVKKGNKRGY
ncbi:MULTISPECIES: MarR family winged helix-turn-helix transcriptional regulator [Bacillaceae]|uniref:MarR family transcriptional regulator n=3 Tax=Bacillaceae TaxID=186817 RepID=A0A9D5I1L1_9BACI|nr:MULTISPECIES: MarR family transcriptional regulator [Bacillaceae]RQW22902.1 MarR family transcriptional regulator [Bacillus sp. C1-1]KQL58339.1 MarR family transcriptional regulator [Alkalicoccobacillus plakortidis]MBG9782901.1 MarR family transcriptional regulator [Shouchella lehensis]MED4129702.1 MarR family transcriptional regulator [Shouchella miscanthi]TES49748.1 MarR family transcriptional regulator [Shouchella lehensis]